MAGDQKAFASLSSGLLARKGAARPAMRPQGFGQVGGGLDDLGWDDLGFEPPRPAVVPRDESHDAFGEELPVQPLRNPLAALTPVQSPVHDQQAEIEERLVPAPDAPEEDEELDETAELYEPEAESPEPVPQAVPPQPVEEVVWPDPAVDELVLEPVDVVRRVREPRSAAGSKAKAAFTLRLEPDRHLKLRLACAVAGCSAQQLVTNALDRLLAGMPEVDAMAVKARRKE